MQENQFLLFLNHLRLPYSIPKSFALLLAFHIARHSFANIARQKNANLYDISKSLGHSSLKITETYLSNFDTESQDKTMKHVFNESITEEMKKEQLIEQLKQLSSDKLAELLKRIE